ncbi:MAG: hypothetical protein Q9177_001478 [Variospora cf. flavescens]
MPVGSLVKTKLFFRKTHRMTRITSEAVREPSMIACRYFIDEEFAAVKAERVAGASLVLLEALLGRHDDTTCTAFEAMDILIMFLEFSFLGEVRIAMTTIAVASCLLMGAEGFLGGILQTARVASPGSVDVPGVTLERGVVNKEPITPGTEAMPRGPLVSTKIVFRPEFLVAGVAGPNMNVAVMVPERSIMDEDSVAQAAVTVARSSLVSINIFFSSKLLVARSTVPNMKVAFMVIARRCMDKEPITKVAIAVSCASLMSVDFLFRIVFLVACAATVDGGVNIAVMIL